MKILLNNHILNKALSPFNDIGFIPTMGGIHDGHISLIKRSNKLCKKTIVSIFVNPSQFNSRKDFSTYPSNIRKDLSLLRKVKGIDFVYIPKSKDVYDKKRNYKILIKKKDKILCAKFRKGHFEGVLDVMDRLTNLIKPKKIFMGKKDFQQLVLVKKFIEERYKTQIIGCNTVRDKNKLALSSRNNLFNKNQLYIAGQITKYLIHLKKDIKDKRNINYFLINEKKKIQKLFNINIEYLEFRKIKNLSPSNNYIGSRLFVAYYFNGIRLIDNF